MILIKFNTISDTLWPIFTKSFIIEILKWNYSFLIYLFFLSESIKRMINKWSEYIKMIIKWIIKTTGRILKCERKLIKLYGNG